MTIMVETFLPEKVQAILDAREHSLETGLDLLRWAREIRTRPIVSPV